MMRIPFLLVILFSLPAFAARTALLDTDTDLLTLPLPKAQPVQRLKKGTHLTASNYPTEGFYKVRIPDGTLGWVKADTLELGPMPNLKTKENPSN